MPVYVQLFHGRSNPDQDLQDWGEQGPVFLVDWFHVTYLHHIRMGDATDDNMELNLVEDMLYYDGMYYGDWSVFHNLQPPAKDPTDIAEKGILSRLVKYDAAKAVPPVRPRPPKDAMVTITFSRNDAGQVLDGIRARKEQWEDTVAHWRGELTWDGDKEPTICESNSEDEAQKIADHYVSLVKQLEAQIA